ncbi:OmpA family protein [Geotalea sp. SG265]|uniref:OmpA family protein n=1 Tax=Geotalea sp. SG265 TaxID=2922867 RepID=UPI001FAFC3B2|nr:OmpA family protein [Geotalea sp. SG265]
MKHCTIILLTILLIPSLVFADENVSDVLVSDVVVGGDNLGVFIVHTDKENYTLDEPITTGKCTSSKLKDIGKVEVKDDKIYVTPSATCLSEKVVDYRNSSIKPLKMIDSKSLYLNYAINGGNANQSLAFGVGGYLNKASSYTDFTYDLKDESGIKRNNSYAIFDDLDDAIRFQVGDTFPQVNSVLISTPAIGGLQVKKNYLLSPTLNPYQSLDYKLTVDNQSVMEIYRDNQLIDRKTLSPGIYDLRNLPIAAVSGNVEIKLRDLYGREKTIPIPYLVSGSLLRKGFSDYSFTAGLERQQGGDVYRKPAFAGFYRYGLSDRLTLGASATHKDYTLSADFLLPVGTFGFQANNKHYGVSYSQTYSLYTFQAAYTVKDEPDFRTTVDASLGKYGSVNLFYHHNGSKQVGAGYSFNVGGGSFNINSSYDSKSHFSAFAGITWAFGGSTNIGVSTSVQENKAYNVSASHILSRDYDASIDANYTNNNSGHGASTSMVNVTAKGTYFNQFVANAYKSSGADSAIYNFTLSGSLAAVSQDGLMKVGIGEPVSPGGGFAIGDELTTLGRKGHGVVPVSSYYTQEIASNSEESRISKELSVRAGQGVIVSATVFRAVTGQFVCTNGEPFTSKTFTADQREWFTADDGTFYIEEIPFTNSRVNCQFSDGQKVDLSIGDREGEIVDLGAISVECAPTPKEVEVVDPSPKDAAPIILEPVQIESRSQEPKIEQKEEINEVKRLVTVRFNKDSYKLTTESKKIIAGVSKDFQGKNTGIVVTGFTCDLGSQEVNDRLAYKRAKAVAKFLDTRGVKAVEIVAKGKCCYSGLGHEIDRRVEISIKN